MNFNYKPGLEPRKQVSNSLHKNYAFLIFVVILLANCSGTKPILIGQFPPCPDKPNCVSSKSSLSLHKIAPLTYEGNSENAREKLLGIINSMPRTQRSMDNENFIHVEFTSKVFQFVDDVEFYFESPRTIHFRSASRVGHSDMGVNRDRMEEIRRLFIQAF
jgi:uncharacterized protein (DUF1499 family)